MSKLIKKYSIGSTIKNELSGITDYIKNLGINILAKSFEQLPLSTLNTIIDNNKDKIELLMRNSMGLSEAVVLTPLDVGKELLYTGGEDWYDTNKDYVQLYLYGNGKGFEKKYSINDSYGDNKIRELTEGIYNYLNSINIDPETADYYKGNYTPYTLEFPIEMKQLLIDLFSNPNVKSPILYSSPADEVADNVAGFPMTINKKNVTLTFPSDSWDFKYGRGGNYDQTYHPYMKTALKVLDRAGTPVLTFGNPGKIKYTDNKELSSYADPNFVRMTKYLNWLPELEVTPSRNKIIPYKEE